MKDRTFDTSSQTQALLNELKGNLFEYLIAQKLASFNGIESQFLASFQGDKKSQFIQYETWIRRNAPSLLIDLPVLANISAQALQNRFDFKLSHIMVIGKQLSESAHYRGRNEGDLFLTESEGLSHSISIKLCKINAFVNTKSGGVKSFVAKYFSQFSTSLRDQEIINQLVDESFQMMGHKLYEDLGLEFKGSFDYQWKEAAMSELPGQLSNEQREIIHHNYQKVIHIIYETMTKYFKENKQLFFESVLLLMGFSNNSIQLICTYQIEKNKHYKFKKVFINTIDEVVDLESEMEILPLKKDISSFEIKFADRVLQIRIKPMNRMTASAHKVNCSVKLTS